MTIVKHIPNTITSMNLLCGLLGVIAAFEDRLDWAFFLMLAAAVCDFLDGFSARALKAYSDMGRELDSLSDLASFGILPSIMLNRTMVMLSGNSLWCHIPLVIAIFSALRLAKFNIDDRQRENFIGLPTPACAILCGALVHYIYTNPDCFLAAWASGKIFLPLLSALLAAMLVSGLPMFSLKFRKGMKKDSVFRLRISFLVVCIITALAVLLLGLKFSVIFMVAIAVYIIMNIVL